MSYTSDVEKVQRTEASEEFPYVLLIDNLNACNLKCSMCDHPNMRKYRKVQLMDMGLYKRLMDEVAIMRPDARIWQIFFGDPFLCNDMPERIQYAKDQGLTDVVLNTNGVLMTHEKAKPLVQAGLDAMYVGVDAIKEETYDKIRVGGDYKTAVKNVLNYRDLLLKYGNGGQKLFVQFVVADINEDEVEAFREFWVSEGVNVKIRPKVSWAGLVDAPNLRKNEELKRKPCYWLMHAINICADGEATLCSVDVHCKVKCGNVTNSTIKEVWDGKLREYRAMHKEGRYDELPEMCKKCSDWQSTYAEFY